MKISRKLYTDIHKYTLITALGYYLAAVFAFKELHYGIFPTLAVAFFNLFHIPFYQSRLRLAALNWLLPVTTVLAFPRALMHNSPEIPGIFHSAVILALSLIPTLFLFLGHSREKPGAKRLPLMRIRILFQIFIFIVYIYFSAHTWIMGSGMELLFWGLFNVVTVALLPFFFGRIVCGWICPNATLQDGLYRFLNYPRPIKQLPNVITSQSQTLAMSSGEVDKKAPYLPFTLLLCWFSVFFLETVFDLINATWYPLAFSYGLFLISLLFPWRQFCVYFCWFSSYRCLVGHNSLWRIRFHRENCKNCKSCAAEKACPFAIDIRNQREEMPATCCVCLNCVEACPFKNVITIKRQTNGFKNRLLERWRKRSVFTK